jgi:chromosome segregation ATPase
MSPLIPAVGKALSLSIAPRSRTSTPRPFVTTTVIHSPPPCTTIVGEDVIPISELGALAMPTLNRSDTIAHDKLEVYMWTDAELEAELTSCYAKLKAQEAELDGAKEALKNSQNSLRSALSTSKRHSTELDNLKAKRNESKHEVDSLRVELESLKKQRVEEAAVLLEAKSSLVTQESRLKSAALEGITVDSLTTAWDVERAAINREVTRLTAKHSEFEAQLATAEGYFAF